MKPLLISLFLILAHSIANSQDLIIKKNGEEIIVKILEVNLSVVKFKKNDNLNGPTFEMLKSDIFMIKYENGTKDIFNSTEKKENSHLVEPITTSSTLDKKDKTKKLAFKEKDKSFSILFGLPASLNLNTIPRYTPPKYQNGGIPISLLFNKAISSKLSFNYGTSLMIFHQEYPYVYGIATASGTSYYIEKTSANLFLVAATAGLNYHFATTDKIDPYLGLSMGIGHYLGLQNIYYSGEGLLLDKNPLLYGAKFGINVLNKRKNAWTFELGYDYLSYLKVGYTVITRK